MHLSNGIKLGPTAPVEHGDGEGSASLFPRLDPRVTLPAPGTINRANTNRAKPIVCEERQVRISIHLDDELIADLDERAGTGRRDVFIADLIRRGLDYERRWGEIEASLGTIADTGHEWDEDPAGWVRAQRAGGGRSLDGVD